MSTINAKDKANLYDAFLLLKDRNECRRFLRDLLTEEEINEFTNRWKVAQMIEKKVPYEVITEETGMSSTTIARVSKWLNAGMGGYKLILNRIHTHHFRANRSRED